MLRPIILKLPQGASWGESWANAEPGDDLGDLETDARSGMPLCLTWENQRGTVKNDSTVKYSVFRWEGEESHQFISTAPLMSITRDKRSILASLAGKRQGLRLQERQVQLIDSNAVKEQATDGDTLFQFYDDGTEASEPFKKKTKKTLSEDEVKFRLYKILKSKEGAEGFSRQDLCKLVGASSAVIQRVLNQIADPIMAETGGRDYKTQVFIIKQEYR